MSRRRAGRSTHEPEPEPDGPPTDAAAAAAAERQARWAKHPLHPGPDAPAGGERGLLSGGLYPTVAVSDAQVAAAGNRLRGRPRRGVRRRLHRRFRRALAIAREGHGRALGRDSLSRVAFDGYSSL